MAASQTTAETRSAAKGLLIYDGDCGFCTSSARWVASKADDGIAITPWQAVDVDALGLTEADVTTAAYFVDGDTKHRGADAIASVLAAMPGRWRPLGQIMARPPVSWLARAVYPFVARYRYRLPGATDACRLN